MSIMTALIIFFRFDWFLKITNILLKYFISTEDFFLLVTHWMTNV